MRLSVFLKNFYFFLDTYEIHMLIYPSVTDTDTIYRGLVKWYDRGLQNLWREFDSLIPCFKNSQVFTCEFFCYLSEKPTNGLFSKRRVQTFWLNCYLFFICPIAFSNRSTASLVVHQLVQKRMADFPPGSFSQSSPSEVFRIIS